MLMSISRPWYVDMYQTWLRMFDDGGLRITIGIIIGLVVAGLVGLILYGLFVACDSWFRPIMSGMATITSKNFTDGYMTTAVVPVSTGTGAGTAIIPTYVPPDWSLYCQVDFENDGDWVSVSEKFYDRSEIGNKVRIDYKTGRFRHGVYVQAIYD